MRKLIKILIIAIAFISILAASGFFYIKSRPVPAVQIGTVNLKDIRDGSYTGEYKSSPVAAVVKVDVAGNKITSIKIEKHETGLGKKAEIITKEIEKKQSLDVDTISGATLSSKVILKAVENALENGKK